MLEAAVIAASELPFSPQVVGVTVLTSLSEQSWRQATGSQWSPSEAVEQMAKEGYAAGIRAFVCSPQEISIIRGLFGSDVKIITPGVRPVWAEKGDQVRILTPAKAIAAGADALVIGRPILSPPTSIGLPADALRAIKDQIMKELV
jgi:orotidine-5'-phosphate decarboxylase